MQRHQNLMNFSYPLLVGDGAGATFAYAVDAQAPKGTFSGLITLGWDFSLRFPKPSCKGDAGESSVADGKGAFRIAPVPVLPNRWLPQPFLQRARGPTATWRWSVVCSTARRRRSPLGWRSPRRRGRGIVSWLALRRRSLPPRRRLETWPTCRWSKCPRRGNLRAAHRDHPCRRRLGRTRCRSGRRVVQARHRSGRPQHIGFFGRRVRRRKPQTW